MNQRNQKYADISCEDAVNFNDVFVTKQIEKGADLDMYVENMDLENGAREFERFWLRPKKMMDREVVLRMKINKKWGGWKLKDELVNAIGLTVGDTINTEVTVLLAPGLIRKADDTDLFAEGTGADWLLDNNVGVGAVIDAKVRFKYCKAPVGGLESKEIWKISLVLIEGYKVVEDCTLSEENVEIDDDDVMKELIRLMAK